MNKEQAKQRIIGGRVIAVEFASTNAFGRSIGEDELLIESLTIDNGIVLNFSGSEQVGVGSVWIDVEEI